MAQTSSLPQLALYHPWPRVKPQPISDWAKTMLLFFDGIAILAPPEAIDTLTAADETTAGPLLEQGLLHLLEPSQLMDVSAANRILKFLETAADWLDAQQSSHSIKRRHSDGLLEWGIGTLDSWPRDGSFRRMAFPSGDRGDETFPNEEILPGDWGIVYPGRSVTTVSGLRPEVRKSARAIWRELVRRGVAATEPDGSFPWKLHPYIWGALEALLAYVLQPAGLNIGLDLQPATDDPGLMRDTMRLLDESLTPSRAHVISSDLEQVGLDLSRVPLNDVLEFRDRHGRQYREYMNRLRLFMIEIGSMDILERQDALTTRSDELVDAAEDLRRISRTWWRRPVATMGVGIAGAVWTASHGDTASAILSLLGGAVGAAGFPPRLQGSYSYLFEARRSLVH
jgi:hypothetical protein